MAADAEVSSAPTSEHQNPKVAKTSIKSEKSSTTTAENVIKPNPVPLSVESKEEFNSAELEWIQLNQELSSKNTGSDGKIVQEDFKVKFTRKFKENPLIPIGALLTAGFLAKGLGKFARKDSAGSQNMMRGRIVAQSFTILAMVAGVIFNVQRSLQKQK